MTPTDVIATYSRCTGIRFRFLPDGVSRQAVKFLERGFTLSDLELVVLWIKRGISRHECGFNPASLGWRCMFGEFGSSDEMLKFQERLGLAEEAVKRGWRPFAHIDPLEIESIRNMKYFPCVGKVAERV